MFLLTFLMVVVMVEVVVVVVVVRVVRIRRCVFASVDRALLMLSTSVY
jgi:hypothetical protein